MTQFSLGQEVEVFGPELRSNSWRKAKIVCGIVRGTVFKNPQDQYEVQFIDGSREVFNVENIRAIDPDYEHAPESKPGGGFL